ncbi:MAG: hypothetical protein JWN02_2509 [Acidobacteria bacterium]|nr:hypothetical protein [Acidobacteriota bacterium]
MTTPKRTRLGRFAGIATRYAVYRTDSAIEIDEMDNFEIQRRRVFFDDIVMITHHRAVGLPYIFWMLLAVALFGGIGLIFALNGEQQPALGIAAGAIPFALLLLLRLWLRVDVITIFGRRTKAVLRYGFRKRFARRTFEDLAARTQAAQQRIVEELEAAVEAQAELPVDMPPVELPGLPPAGVG